MLYDTAARANEILALNIEDLDSDRKRADITGKGGHHETIVWASGTARLLPRSTPPGPTLHRPPPTQHRARRTRPLPRHRTRPPLLPTGLAALPRLTTPAAGPCVNSVTPPSPTSAKQACQRCSSKPKAATKTPDPGPATPNPASKPPPASTPTTTPTVDTTELNHRHLAATDTDPSTGPSSRGFGAARIGDHPLVGLSCCV